MERIPLSADPCDKLLAAPVKVELTDESGNVLGEFKRFTRIGNYVVQGELPSTDDLDRRLSEGKLYSSAEVEARLRTLREAVQ